MGCETAGSQLLKALETPNPGAAPHHPSTRRILLVHRHHSLHAELNP